MTAPDDMAVIFDLDGTLVQSYEFDDHCYTQAVREVLGAVPFDTCWNNYKHVTDSGILGQIIRDHHVPDESRVLAEVRNRFGEMISDYLKNDGPCKMVPGAAQALDELQARGVLVGIATGGWGHTAEMKLHAAGLLRDGMVLTSADDAPERTQIMQACFARLGNSINQVIYVGDAEWDIAASAKLGWQFIGIGERVKGRCPHWIADYINPAWITTRESVSA